MERKSDLESARKITSGYLFPVTIVILGIMLIVNGCSSGGGGNGEPTTPLSPTAPTNVTVTAGDDQITISWDNVPGATSYTIYWSTSTGVTKDNCEGEIPEATNPYVHRGLVNGKTYFYIVTAANSNGESEESSETSATPFTPYPDTVIDTIPVGKTPVGIAISPGGNYLYVGNLDDRTVSVIQTSNNTVIDTIPLDEEPFAMVMNPNGSYVYVTMPDDKLVAVIRTSDNTVVDTIPVGGEAFGMAMSPNGNYLYVVDVHDDTMSVIQTSNNTIVDTVSLEEFPLGAVVSPDGKYIYVTDVDVSDDETEATSIVEVIQTSDNTVIDTVTINTFPLDEFDEFPILPMSIAISPDGNYLYVVNVNIASIEEGTATDSTISVIQTTNNTLIDTISMDKLSYFFGIAVTPNGKYVYVTHLLDNEVSVIRTSDNAVIDTISVGKTPMSITMAPDGEHVYVVNVNNDVKDTDDDKMLDGTISVIGLFN